MKLSAFTSGSGPSITFIHGFTQTARSWSDVMNSLPEFACISLDAPGHGDSVISERTLAQCGDDIAETMATGILVGYSMGARMALHTALQHPEKVERLVLVSGTAGIEDDRERAQRVASDEELASHIEDIGVPAFITEWLANPMFSGLTAQTSQKEERHRNTAHGLANSLRYAGTGTQTPLWHLLSELKMPVLLLVGENDQKFKLLAERMNEIIPHSRLAVIPNAGHTLHLENHQRFIEELRRFVL